MHEVYILRDVHDEYFCSTAGPSSYPFEFFPDYSSAEARAYELIREHAEAIDDSYRVVERELTDDEVEEFFRNDFKICSISTTATYEEIAQIVDALIELEVLHGY